MGEPDSAPRAAPPAGACDAHVHLFGPLSRYPAATDSPYAVPDATPAQLLETQRAAGIARAVVVHAVTSGRDNLRTLDALRDEPERLRGVLTPPLSSPDDATLLHWHRLGVRGIRFSYTATAQAGMRVDPVLAARVSEHGWHAQVHVHDEQIVELAACLSALPGRIVIDHMARIPAHAGVGGPAFASLLRLLDSGRVWVKLSAPMRLSAERYPYADVAPMARALVAHAPERVVWGSDWPNVNFDGALPSYAALVALLDSWVPDARLRHRILVENACALYDFPLPTQRPSSPP
ncbi:MAG: amidohydrolase [Lautropia sp.]